MRQNMPYLHWLSAKSQQVPHNPSVSYADSSLYTLGPQARTERNRRKAAALSAEEGSLGRSRASATAR